MCKCWLELLFSHFQFFLSHTSVFTDPNYGQLWFYCKSHPSDGSLAILHVAKTILADEIACYSDIYIKSLQANNNFKETLKEIDSSLLVEGSDFCMVSFF